MISKVCYPLTVNRETWKTALRKSAYQCGIDRSKNSFCYRYIYLSPTQSDEVSSNPTSDPIFSRCHLLIADFINTMGTKII